MHFRLPMPIPHARLAGLIALLLLAACRTQAADDAAATDSAAVAAPPAASPAADSVPPPLSVERPAPAPEIPPSREDSAAGAREGVSPEWKQRERSMAGYERCIEQARETEEPLRERIIQACRRLPDAPQ